MSRSQSRCMMLILRHAWLNLLDKHMTTGRINQVAVVGGNSQARANSDRGPFPFQEHKPCNLEGPGF